MAFLLKSYGVRSDDSIISFLVVATSDLCEKIGEALLKNSRQRKCRVVVHRCESIGEVVRLQPELCVDFMIFAFDWRVRNSIAEIEVNLNLIDARYVFSGRACLINCTGVPTPLNVTFDRARQICRKLNIPLLTRNILNTNNVLSLGEALLNLAEVRLGTKIGIPILPRPRTSME